MAFQRLQDLFKHCKLQDCTAGSVHQPWWPQYISHTKKGLELFTSNTEAFQHLQDLFKPCNLQDCTAGGTHWWRTPTVVSTVHQPKINRPRTVCFKYGGFSAFAGSVQALRLYSQWRTSTVVYISPQKQAQNCLHQIPWLLSACGICPSPKTVQPVAYTHSDVHSTSAKELRLSLLRIKSYRKRQRNFTYSACC